jgi:hypothetical protein
MPTKKTWLLRVPEIREELSAMKVPVVDRAIFERLFGVRRRRAIQLMHFFNGYQSGRTFWIDRLSLIEQLVPLEASTEFSVELRRRQRLVESLEQLRRSRAGARVVIPVESGDQTGATLPPGVQFEPGILRVAFDDVRDLLAKLYRLSQAAAADYEAFRAAAENNPHTTSALALGQPPGLR